MSAPFVLIRSALPGVVWPAIVAPEHASALALQYQLQRSQWLRREELQALQFRQLDGLLRHAFRTVPLYAARWRGLYDGERPITPQDYERLPVLTRGDLQDGYEALRSREVPPDHGAAREGRTSGSTGPAARTLRTDLIELWWRALTLRDHLWHKRDFTGRLAAIRHGVERGESEGWGPATSAIALAGPSATLPISTSVEAQLEWLVALQPDYLLAYPSIVAELARRSIANGIRLARLREVRTIGEVVTDATRALCRQAWNVPLTDAYTSDEVGYIALQCPAAGHYHVQSESVIVEVLDERGAPCAPGVVGRVVVTTLQNFAMPLVRYDLGDYAEAGPPCSCGRGLAVLTRILGRRRNRLALPDGGSGWPAWGTLRIDEIAPVLQHRLVQKDYDRIEAQLVTAAPLTPGQEEGLRRRILARLPVPMGVAIARVPGIPRDAGGKHEEFVCEVAER